MKKEDIEHFTNERLSQWAKILIENDATPAVLIGVRHNNIQDTDQGHIHVCTVEGISNLAIKGLLLSAADGIEL